MSQDSIKSMNNKLKSYINEASGISTKCKLKLVKLIEKHFQVDLPNENYLNLDISILENGNIIMRDIEYKTNNEITSSSDLVKIFEEFQKDAESLLNKNTVSFDTMSKKNNRNNLIWVIIISLAIIVIALNAFRQLLSGNLFGVLWLIIIIGYYVIPATGNSIRNRYIKAYQYLKSIIYKKKK